MLLAPIAQGIDSKEWNSTYGVHTSNGAINLTYVTSNGTGPSASILNVGSRLYLLEDDDHYQIFKLKNREFTFDVDSSQLGCGLNGALYFVEMDADGGKAKYPSNKAGAKYGTGYCDGQCARDLKWVKGKANVEGWALQP